ncbi:hypothetical protein ACFP7A_03290 [Sporolactobacillus kofuensis]|uniref:Uncharacterized protein n=1 Tax=Sporolactobacillus kofuensis TaxID=269672 RepID=A0ABW1WDE3_9BACL|nr:hypothetical protein [Sporolactobacillus kofuensis]MCO7174573.1 hypothetical protein [Sporolactobacillus kofuensis]
MGSNNIGENDYNFADLLQLIGQWLTTTGDTFSLVGQIMALEKDRNDAIQTQIDKQQEALQKQQSDQQVQQQIAKMQEQINHLQNQIDKKDLNKLD